MSSKIINYTNRDFDSLKQFVVNYAKQFYPETYQDFSEASPGSMFIDMICYIGDILSFYIDYQANEVFLESSQQFNNIVKLAREKGYRDTGKPSATGEVDFYIIVPADSNGQPNSNYIPILQKDSSFSVQQTNASYILKNDVDFNDTSVETIVASVDSNGIPSTFALKATGEVISGAFFLQKEVTPTTFDNFLKIKINNPLMTEIISVIDSNGNEYYQVDYLVQNVVYKLIKNTDFDSSTVPYKFVKIYAPRRFVIEQIDGFYYLVFGNGSIDSITDPRKLVLDYHSREFVSERRIDPKNILQSDKFGISPVNTTLSIVYRANNSKRMGAPISQLNKVLNPILKFPNTATSQTVINSVRSSIEVDNSSAISSVNQIITADELKRRAYAAESSQFRCVTKEDYIFAAYALDPRLGGIKLANILVDKNSPRKNLQMYICSEDSEGHLTVSTQTLKNNLKTWLLSQKMIADSIDILDPIIINFAIEFTVDTNETNKNVVLVECINSLKDLFATSLDIGESLHIDQIYKTLNSIQKVIDTKRVKIQLRNGNDYSESTYDLYGNLSADGSYIMGKSNIVFELKFPEKDLIGTVI